MEEQHQHHDDQSHYEISLTAGQAFMAFVLLLLSLAASFAFGLMLGKGQADERLVVQKETPVVTEASVVPSPKKTQGEIVELGVEDEDFKPAPDAAAATETAATPIVEEAAATATVEATVTTMDAPKIAESGGEPPQSKAVPHYAQLLSTGDQKTAETLAAKLIDGGYNSAYVERGVATEKGPVFRVRIKFASETEARAAEPKLREFSKEVWITSK